MKAPLQVAGDLVQLYRAERATPGALRDRQEARLRRVVAHAHAHVPFWRRVMEARGIAPDAVRTLDDLGRFPVTNRAELQRASLADLTSDAFPPDALSQVRTTGSTGRPLTICVERRQLRRRQALFLRALMAAGMYPGQSMLLVSHDRGRTAPPWLRWRYASPDLPAPELAAIFASQAPTNLYGWVTPLRQMALHARDQGLRLPRARRIFTTAEALDEATSRLLAEQLGAVPSSIYGSIELGTVAWQCSARRGFHLSEDTTLVEFLPIPGGGAACRLVATSLDSLATPLIRYDTGDLASAPPVRSRCSCACRYARVERIEGRLVDSVRLAGGRLLSPFVLTEAIEDVPGVDRFQVVQEEMGRFVVRAEGHATGRPASGAEIIARLRRLVGELAIISVQWEDRLEPAPGVKFRVVESRVR